MDDSPADCLYIKNYYKILFKSIISNLVAGANFAKRDKCQVLRALSKNISVKIKFIHNYLYIANGLDSNNFLQIARTLFDIIKRVCAIR